MPRSRTLVVCRVGGTPWPRTFNLQERCTTVPPRRRYLTNTSVNGTIPEAWCRTYFKSRTFRL